MTMLDTAPRRTPVAVPNSPPKSKVYAVKNRAGTVVGYSLRPVRRPEDPASHAKEFLAWLSVQDEFAGECVLAKALMELYVKVFCARHRLKALPWKSVARHLIQLTGGDRPYRYVDNDLGDYPERRKLRAYEIPSARL